MSVEQPNVIDVVSIEKGTGRVILTISDHLDWSNSHSHQLTLQRKFNTYLASVESGELKEAYPHAEGKPVTIKVVMKYRPDPSGFDFLAKARDVIENAGIEFRSEIFAESYGN